MTDKKRPQKTPAKAPKGPVPKDAAEKVGADGDRIAKVLARAGVCSRRDAEKLIAAGRVIVNGHKLDTPAYKVLAGDDIRVDGKPIAKAERRRLWLYHKPAGLVTSHRDEQGRETIFQYLPKKMPRVVSVGRLDLNSEGLLLLTNDGELSRHLELPSTGWPRTYRVRARGRLGEGGIAKLAKGMVVEGVKYGPIKTVITRQQTSNLWLEMTLHEGKNREIRRVLNALGLDVNRLIRVGYGPFILDDLPLNETWEVPSEQIEEALKVDFSKL